MIRLTIISLIISVLIISAAIAACGSPPTPTPTPIPTQTPIPTPVPCYIQAEPFVQQVDSYLAEWDDTNVLASSTSRMSLSPVISHLQDVRRNMAAIPAPACVGQLRDNMLTYMDETINGYLAFMTQKSDSEVSAHFDAASTAFKAFIDLYSKLKAGVLPFK